MTSKVMFESVTFVLMPRKAGGGAVVRYSVVAKTKVGGTLGFNFVAGRPGTQPAQWPVRDRALADAPRVFTCPGIKKLPDALRDSVDDAGGLRT